MSQCNVVELLRQKDCMCIGLAIKRSEATISDPSRLVIKRVYPVFMSLDSFLDSALFSLQLNQDAAGNFDIKDEGGKLAVGAGREELTGLTATQIRGGRGSDTSKGVLRPPLVQADLQGRADRVGPDDLP